MCDSKQGASNQDPEIIKKAWPALNTVRDPRAVMKIAYGVFTAQTPVENLVEYSLKNHLSPSDFFYSRLYLGLYYEAKGKSIQSKEFIDAAVNSIYGKQSSDYMVSLAKVHFKQR